MRPCWLRFAGVLALALVLILPASGCRRGVAARGGGDAEAASPGSVAALVVADFRINDPSLVPTGLDEPVDFVWAGEQRLIVLGRQELLVLDTVSGPRQRRSLTGDAVAMALVGDWLWVVMDGRAGRLPVADLDAEMAWTELPAHGRWTGLAQGEHGALAANWLRLTLFDVPVTGPAAVLVLKDEGGETVNLVAPSPYLTVRRWPDGGFMVNDPGRHQLLRFRADGLLTMRFGAPGMAPGEWCGCCNPIDFDVSEGGLVATAEKGCRRVQLFSAAGQWQGMVAQRDDFIDDERQCDLRGIDPVERWLKVRFDGAQSIWVLERCTGDLRRFARPLAEESDNE